METPPAKKHWFYSDGRWLNETPLTPHNDSRCRCYEIPEVKVWRAALNSQLSLKLIPETQQASAETDLSASVLSFCLVPPFGTQSLKNSNCLNHIKVVEPTDCRSSLRRGLTVPACKAEQKRHGFIPAGSCQTNMRKDL